METPQTLKQHKQLEYTQGELRKYDPFHGGIYHKKMVRAMEQFSQTRRLTNNVGTVLAEQGSKFADPSNISPHDLCQEIPVVSFDFLGWLGDILDHWGTGLAAITLLLVCFKALSFASSLLARWLAAHWIWGCQFHLLAAVLPSVLQWMAIQLGLWGVWPAIEGDDPSDHEVESFLTHARRSVMKDRISKKDHRKRDNYCDGGSLAELGALGARRKEPTGCNSIIEMHTDESFRILDSFKPIAMGSPHSPAAIHRHQLAQIHSENEQSATSLPVCHPMYEAGNQRLQDLRAGRFLLWGEDLHSGTALGNGGLENLLYPDVGLELAMEEVPNAPGHTESEESSSYVNQPSGHP
jgi:hypothetical protein